MTIATELQVTQNADLQVLSSFEHMAGIGTEVESNDELLMPRVIIVQTQTRQKLEQDGMEGVKVGMFYNDVTREMSPSLEGVICNSFIFYKELSSNRGELETVATYLPSDPIVMQATKAEEGGLRLPNGNQLKASFRYYIRLSTGELAALSVGSGSMLECKRLKSDLQRYTIDGVSKTFVAPVFFHKIRFTTKYIEAKGRNWYSIQFKRLGWSAEGSKEYVDSVMNAHYEDSEYAKHHFNS